MNRKELINPGSRHEIMLTSLSQFQAQGWKVELPDLAPIQFLIASTSGAALGDGKKLVNRFMAAKPKIAPRSRSAKNPPVSIMPRRRGQTFQNPSRQWNVEADLVTKMLEVPTGKWKYPSLGLDTRLQKWLGRDITRLWKRLVKLDPIYRNG